jgi:hypothetical protein
MKQYSTTLLKEKRNSFFSSLIMSNLRKKVVKQQSRLAALNLLGTPAGSEAESDVDSEHSSSSSVIGNSVIPHLDESTVEDDLRRCIDDLGEKRTRYVISIDITIILKKIG